MKNLKKTGFSFVFFSFLVLLPNCVSSEVSHIPYDLKDAAGVPNLVPVIVIGAGPAGLSAGLYTCRANQKTIIIGAGGGQLTKTTYVENWPGIKKMLGTNVVKTVREQAQLFGAEFITDFVDRVDFSTWPFVVHTQNGFELHALAVVVATGAVPRYLHIPGEEEYWGSGVTACAICDAPFFKGEEVVVVGGGDAAAEEATQLAGYASKVTILVRKGRMRAAPTMQDRLKAYPNISVKYNVSVKEIVGDGTFVTGVKLINNETGKESIFPTAGVFLAIGRIPNSQIFSDYIDIDHEGHIEVIGRSQRTSVPGVFAAGDVANPHYKQAGVASGDGIKAGLDASRYLAALGLSEVAAKELESTFFDPAREADQSIELAAIKTQAEFEAEVEKSKIPVVVDFYTQHCPSCLQMLPYLKKVAAEFAGKVKVYKIDGEQAEQIVESLAVFSVPCLIAFKNGDVATQYKQEVEQAFAAGEPQKLKEINESFDREGLAIRVETELTRSELKALFKRLL